ncbi:Conserved_hypothetical protein [Hexamita inflata]|uniref:Uncharacterized protein n=1 Tax=Hexamita inflata TaxID=28002 RepID=A0AA86QLJ0_9EUKA|nr:Conserved hypothetical protein [Hexamita inflata]
MIMIINCYTSPETKLLQDEEPLGTYPFQRQEIECYQTNNKLVVDVSSNTVCIILNQLNELQCQLFPKGVFYDIHFDNQASWRTHQRDFNFQQTTKFCFPCYNNDCSFITQTTLVTVQLVSAVKISLIQIGAIVIQKSNQSDCYDSSISSLGRSNSMQVLKLYPKASCNYVYSDCVMTRYVEDKYGDVLISSESTDVTPAEWDQIKILNTDEYGLYFQITQNKQIDPHDQLLFSIFRIYYQCPKIVVHHTIKINLITSVAHSFFGTTIIENQYIEYQSKNVHHFELQSEVNIQVKFMNKSTNQISNVLFFRVNEINFEKQYLYCENVQSMLYNFTNDEQNISEQCQNFLYSQNSFNQLQDIVMLITLEFDGILISYQLNTASTGCWEYVNVTQTEDQLCFQAQDAFIESCPFIQQQRVNISALIQLNGEIEILYSCWFLTSSAFYVTKNVKANYLIKTCQWVFSLQVSQRVLIQKYG